MQKQNYILSASVSTLRFFLAEKHQQDVEERRVVDQQTTVIKTQQSPETFMVQTVCSHKWTFLSLFLEFLSDKAQYGLTQQQQASPFSWSPLWRVTSPVWSDRSWKVEIFSSECSEWSSSVQLSLSFSWLETTEKRLWCSDRNMFPVQSISCSAMLRLWNMIYNEGSCRIKVHLYLPKIWTLINHLLGQMEPVLVGSFDWDQIKLS